MKQRILNLLGVITFIAILGVLLVSNSRADYPLQAGATSQCVPIWIANSSVTTGAGRTGITSGLSGFSCSYTKSLTPTTVAAITLTGGGFTELDATAHPGSYNVCLPNAALTGFTGLGGEWVEVTCSGGANVAQSQTRFPLNPPATIVATAANSIREIAFAPTGLFQAGSTTSIVVLASSETSNDITGQELCIHDGVGAKQCRPMTNYNTSTKAATVFPLFTNAPASGDGYQIGSFVAGSATSCPTTTDIWTAATRTLTGAQTFNLTGNVTGNLSGSVGSVTGAVGSVTGAVGSVTGNVGGNVVGNVNGNVAGSVGSVTTVGSVTGAVGSVTGNVGGNLVGNVNGNVVGSVGSVTTVGSVTGNVGGNVNGNVVGSIGSFAAGSITSASFGTDVIGHTKTAAAASTASVTLANTETYGDKSLNNNTSILIASSSNGIWQNACVCNYASATRVATFCVPLKIAPTGTVKYSVLPTPNCYMGIWPQSH